MDVTYKKSEIYIALIPKTRNNKTLRRLASNVKGEISSLRLEATKNKSLSAKLNERATMLERELNKVYPNV